MRPRNNTLLKGIPEVLTRFIACTALLYIHIESIKQSTAEPKLNEARELNFFTKATSNVFLAALIIPLLNKFNKMLTGRNNHPGRWLEVPTRVVSQAISIAALIHTVTSAFDKDNINIVPGFEKESMLIKNFRTFPGFLLFYLSCITVGTDLLHGLRDLASSGLLSRNNAAMHSPAATNSELALNSASSTPSNSTPV
jgi:hypothetical protein